MKITYDTNHTFAVCAYKDSPYLEECIRSLTEQKVPTNIILCTSTPSPYIQDLADKYQIPVYVREGKSDIQDDWNFAYDTAKTQYVTIAHQDDIYGAEYTKVLFEKMAKYRDMSMFFCSYEAIKGTTRDAKERSSMVKRLLCLPVSFTPFAHWKWLKKSCICMGNSISCPMITYNKNIVGDTPFQSKLKYALDWEMNLKVACMPGRFVYEKKPLGFYRIHEQATSKEFILNNKKEQEDIEMFCHFWPMWLVKGIMVFYKKSYSAYD